MRETEHCVWNGDDMRAADCKKTVGKAQRAFPTPRRIQPGCAVFILFRYLPVCIRTGKFKGIPHIILPGFLNQFQSRQIGLPDPPKRMPQIPRRILFRQFHQTPELLIGTVSEECTASCNDTLQWTHPQKFTYPVLRGKLRVPAPLFLIISGIVGPYESLIAHAVRIIPPPCPWQIPPGSAAVLLC